jgi:hypothetical protein
MEAYPSSAMALSGSGLARTVAAGNSGGTCQLAVWKADSTHPEGARRFEARSSRLSSIRHGDCAWWRLDEASGTACIVCISGTCAALPAQTFPGLLAATTFSALFSTDGVYQFFQTNTTAPK